MAEEKGESMRDDGGRLLQALMPAMSFKGHQKLLDGGWFISTSEVDLSWSWGGAANRNSFLWPLHVS